MPSRYYRVPLPEIGYVRMIVESYDGLAVVRSLGGGRGEIEWLLCDGMEAEADELAERLRSEVGLCPIARPGDWTDLGNENINERTNELEVSADPVAGPK